MTDADRQKRLRRTKKGFACKMFYNHVSKSKIRGHDKPLYTKYDLFNWLTSQSEWESLWNKYIESNYDKMLAPSVDRVDDYKGYSFDNIKLTTWGENKNKGHRDCFNGKNNKRSVSVKQYTINGDLINQFNSISIASRETNISRTSITNNLSGLSKTAGGYVWKK